MPTGRVVGVVQRNWRDYVASFAENEVNASSWTSMFSGPPWISPVSPNLLSECAISRWKFSFTFGCRWLIKMLTFVWIEEIILVGFGFYESLSKNSPKNKWPRCLQSNNYSTLNGGMGVVSRNWLILGIFNKFFFKITFTFEHRLKWTHGYVDVLGLQWQGPPLP